MGRAMGAAGRATGASGRATGIWRRRFVRVALSSGLPGFSASACWRATNGTGAGGGTDRVTTGCAKTDSRGLGMEVMLSAECPITLSRLGAIGAVLPITWAEAQVLGETVKLDPTMAL